MTIEKVKVKSGALAGKAYRMHQCKDGRCIPRDPAFPIDAAVKSIAKTNVAAAKLEELEVTKQAQAAVAKVAEKAAEKAEVKEAKK